MSRNPVFAPVHLPTLKHNIAEIISEAIFSGKIKPGERLNESQLARDLHVSRAPIREALQQLEEQGIIVNHPRRGMFVVNLDEEDVQKIKSVRLVLEAEAMRLARANFTPAAHARLNQILDRMERSEGGQPSLRVKLDYEFHRAIWALTGNEYFEKTLAGLVVPLFAYSVIRAMKSDKVRHVIYSHRPLIDFLAGKSAEAVEELLADHLKIPWSPPERCSSNSAAAKKAEKKRKARS
ncbi:MAG: GntR family transcriptional regulator [Bryobacterales bacterium]|nr:GntR family transcriptional regulator [Bryobacterales bacterium]